MGSTHKPVNHKACTCLFVCLKTRAIHIEVCKTLETEEFMAKLRRFCNRCGTPSNIYSDNGSNFIGGSNELKDIRKLLSLSTTKKQDRSAHVRAKHTVEFHSSPGTTLLWFVGSWCPGHEDTTEKDCLTLPMRQDELECLLTEVESILNNRPLVHHKTNTRTFPCRKNSPDASCKAAGKAKMDWFEQWTSSAKKGKVYR